MDPRLAAKAAERAEAAARAEAEGARGMSEAELAAIKRRVADVLLAGETVSAEHCGAVRKFTRPPVSALHTVPGHCSPSLPAHPGDAMSSDHRPLGTEHAMDC